MSVIFKTGYLKIIWKFTDMNAVSKLRKITIF